jgi:hypothetical protein
VRPKWRERCDDEAVTTTAQLVGAVASILGVVIVLAGLQSAVLRAQLRSFEERLGGRINASEERLGGRINASGERLGGRIDTLTVRVEASEERLGGRINASEQRLGGRIDTLAVRVDGLDARLLDVSTEVRKLRDDVYVPVVRPPARRRARPRRPTAG